MFGYIHASDAPPTPREPAPQPEATPKQTPAEKQVAMPVIFDLACIALGVLSIIAALAGHDVNVNVPYRTLENDDEA